MASLEQIGADIGRNQGIIDQNNNEIGRLRRSLEQLKNFLDNVRRQSSAFGTYKNSKSNAIERVGAVAKNSVVASGYYRGMKILLSETGNKILGKVFEVLIAKTVREIQALERRIADCQNNINRANVNLQKAKDAYKEEEKKMREK